MSEKNKWAADARGRPGIPASQVSIVEDYNAIKSHILTRRV